MGSLPIIIAVVALIVAIVALLVGGVLTRTPRVRFPNVSLDLDTPTITSCVGDFVGKLDVTATYPTAPPTAQDPVQVTLSIFMPDNVTVAFSSTALRFTDTETQEIDFSGKLRDPCKDGSFRVIASVRGTSLSRGASSREGNVASSGFDITEEVPGVAILRNDGVTFDYKFTPKCCLAQPGESFRVVTGNQRNVSINDRTDITPSIFTCPSAGQITPVTITGTKTAEDPGSFVVLILDERAAVIVCAVATVRVE